MKRDELPLVALDGRRAGELIAHPDTTCGRPHCTIGAHLWQSTLDAAPGPRATNTDPPGRTWPTDTTSPERTDTTANLHTEYVRKLVAYQNAARDLTRFIDANRPDRWTPLPAPHTDDDWCRNHLTVGICEPRYRGDLCRRCYEIGQAHGTAPDPVLMRQLHQGQRLTDTLVGDFLARVRVIRKTKRTTTRTNKRSRKAS